MEKHEIIEKLSKYFQPYELVSKQVYDKYKATPAKIWDFFSKDILWVLLVLREDILKCPMTINNWKSGGSFSQRGLRCNLDPLVKDKDRIYLSAHCLGQGLDFTTKIYSPNKVREMIRSAADKLPCNIRLENDKSAPTWVHVDVCCSSDSRITEFND